MTFCDNILICDRTIFHSDLQIWRLELALDVYEIIQEFEEGAEHRNITVEILDLASPGISNQAKILQETMDSDGKASWLNSESLQSFKLNGRYVL